MLIVRYDGSFYGLILALLPYLRKNSLPDAIECENAEQPSLAGLDDGAAAHFPAATNVHAYDAQIFRIPGISVETWQNAWHAFLSQAGQIEMAIARYLLFALEKRGSVNSFLTDARVSLVHRLARRVLCERHRFMGLLRFRHIGGNLYYAALQSDNFLLPLLAPFFVKRLSDQQWIIHDRRRGMAAVYNLKTWTIIERSAVDLPAESPIEDEVQQLWQGFFDSIAVRERLNLALQQKFIPKKYWSELVEKPGR